MEDNFSQGTFTLQIDSSNTPYLTEAAKWGKFLSILGFVFILLLVLAGCIAIFTGSTFSSADLTTELQSLQVSEKTAGKIMGTYLLVIALVNFFPCLFLYNFSSKMQTALRHNDQISLNRSFNNLKSLLKFFGILAIIFICLWALILTFTFILGFAFSS